jgi:hypothetical protein
MHGAQGIAKMLVQAGGDDAQPQNPVGDEHVLEHGEFLAQKIITLLLEDIELHGPVQGVAHVLDLDRFRDVAEDAAEVHGIHGDAEVSVGGDHHAHEARAKLAGALKELDPLFPRHALVGKQHADLFPVLLDEFEAFSRTAGGEDAELALRKIFRSTSVPSPRHQHREQHSV